MSIFTAVATPARFAAAVAKPIEWVWTSQRSPINTVPGESNGIGTIKEADATDVATYGAPLEEGDVFITHGTLLSGVLTVGQAVMIRNTASDLYEGVHHVTGIISSTVTIIDAERGLGTETNGTIEKHYEGYRLKVQVSMENISGAVIRRPVANRSGEFRLNVGEIAQRSFLDVFDAFPPGDTNVNLLADGYITQEYSLFVSDGFMVPDDNGLNVYTESTKFGQNYLSHSGFVAVNSVQPWHHIDEDEQEPDLQWEEDMGAYEVDIDTTGADRKRFLTYAQRGCDQTVFNPIQGKMLLVGPEDDLALGYLWAGDPDTPLRLVVSSYDEDDVIIGTTQVHTFTSPVHSGIIGVGPRNLGSLVDTSAHHYKVAITNFSEFLITEVFCFEIDNSCKRFPRRFHWKNKFGSIDSYTAYGDEKEEVNVERAMVSKPYMYPTTSAGLSATGDWNFSVYKTEVTRKQSVGTRTERRQVLRWLAEGILETSDVRTWIYLYEGSYRWTKVNMLTNSHGLGYKAGRLMLEYFFGVDGQTQRS